MFYSQLSPLHLIKHKNKRWNKLGRIIVKTGWILTILPKIAVQSYCILYCLFDVHEWVVCGVFFSDTQFCYIWIDHTWVWLIIFQDFLCLLICFIFYFVENIWTNKYLKDTLSDSVIDCHCWFKHSSTNNVCLCVVSIFFSYVQDFEKDTKQCKEWRNTGAQSVFLSPFYLL
jgi:hypothetical protein